ncbi:MAG: twin-arginine translocase TatA/TatE family subunit [Anaeromyxobacter sp.]
MFEFLLILLIVVVLFGAQKLPALGAGFGKAMRNFKQAANGEAPPKDTPGPGEPPRV